MTLFRFIAGLALLGALGGLPLVAEPPPLPFTLDDPDGHWHLTTVERSVPDGLKLVALLSPRTGPARLLVFNVTAPATDVEPLSAFAERIRAAVVNLPPLNSQNLPAKKIGYAGQLLRFDCERDGARFTCEIFVFAVERERWGLLQVLAASSDDHDSTFSLLKKAAPVPAGAVTIAPFRVKEDPITSFPLSLRVLRNTTNDHVDRIIVTEVPPDSVTDRAGVKVGDEVLRIDDRPIGEFIGGVGRRSDLGKIFIDRTPGSSVELTIITPGEAAPRRVTLVSGLVSNPFFRR